MADPTTVIGTVSPNVEIVSIKDQFPSVARAGEAVGLPPVEAHRLGIKNRLIRFAAAIVALFRADSTLKTADDTTITADHQL